MQKLIAKYGLAAHLAMLAVAPLFLFPFVGDSDLATVMLWLSALVFTWVILVPSVRSGEALHNARSRVASAIVHDPLFWASLLLIVFTGIRALNGGIGLAYDAETSKWYVKTASLPFFPGSAGNSGYLPFAISVAGAVLLQGCRHAVGESARMSFLLVSSALAGAAALLAIMLLTLQDHALLIEEASNLPKTHSSVGLAFGLYLMGGTIATVALFKHKWNLLVPLAFLSVGGGAAGAFVFSPPYVSLVLAVAEVLFFICAFVHACRVLEGSGKFKFLVIFGISLTLGGLLVAMLLPQQTAEAKAAPFLTMSFIDDAFFDLRAGLSRIAFKSWISHLWVGTGLDSFPLDFRFSAEGEDWDMAKGGAIALANGWWLALVERGIVGFVFLLIPCGFLLFTYVCRAFGGIRARVFPDATGFLGLLVLVSVAVIGFVSCSPLRADALLVTGAFLAISAKGFRGSKRF